MKNYPKTYEECCAVMGLTAEQIERNTGLQYQTDALKEFQRIIFCRDAYLFIHNKDEYKKLKERYAIKADKGKLVKVTTTETSHLLSFPTAEMRDGFYDNFKSDIMRLMKFL